MVWDVRCCYSLDDCAHPVTKGSSVGTLVFCGGGMWS